MNRLLFFLFFFALPHISFAVIQPSAPAVPDENPVIAETVAGEIQLSRLNEYLWRHSLMDNEMEKLDLRQGFLDHLRTLAFYDVLLTEAEKNDVTSDLAWRASVGEAVRQEILITAEHHFSLVPPDEVVKFASDEVTTQVEQRMEEFRLPDVASWRHILLEPAPGRPDPKSRLEDVLSDIRTGISFPELVKKWSDEPDASEKQVFGPTAFGTSVVPEMARVLGELQPGEISDPLHLPFGIMVIELVERSENRYINEEKRRVTVLFELRRQQSLDLLEKNLTQFREEFPVVRGSADNPEGLYLSCDDFELTAGEMTHLARGLQGEVGDLARENIWAEEVMNIYERQFLLLAGYRKHGPLDSSAFDRWRRFVDWSMAASLTSHVVTDKSVVPVSESEVKERYQRSKSLLEGWLVDATLLSFPVSRVAELAPSASGYDQKKWMLAIREEWIEGQVSARELAAAYLNEDTAATAVTVFEDYPLVGIDKRYRALFQDLSPGETSEVVKLPVTWTIARLHQKSFGIPPFEAVAAKLTAEIRDERSRMALLELRERLLDEYGFRCHIDVDSFYWDDEARDLRVHVNPEESGSVSDK